MISPSSVITIAEKKKALSPAKTESDSSVSKTLVLTFPQITVASTELEFLRRSRTHAASALPPFASSCKRNWLRLKMARLRPANSADCTTQAMMPSQVQKAVIEGMDACSNLLIRGTSSTWVQGMPRWVLQHIGWRSQRWDRPPALRDAIGSGSGSYRPSMLAGLTVTVSPGQDRKSTRLNSSHLGISYAVFCL